MRPDLPGHLLACLMAAQMIASVEVKRGSLLWVDALPAIDDAIERAIAENVSIGVPLILQSQPIDT
mgnify:FL=1